MGTNNVIKVFDTTLRDGQQCPGAGMSVEENFQYAQLAAKCGIDVLEAGFPAASQSEFDMVKAIVEQMSDIKNGPIIAALCQLREAQVLRTIEALEPGIATKQARLHTYLPVDPQLMESSLGSYAKDKKAILKDLGQLVSTAVSAGLEVEFSPEGYSRCHDNFDFVTDVFRAVIEAGGNVINCPDTIGGACRWQGEDYIVNLMNRHADIISNEYANKEVIWSIHCHNDFGLALDNTMNAVFSGPARQVEGCINGIGERAGNVALEQCIMYIKHFGSFYDKDNALTTNIKTEYLKEISDFVSDHMLKRQAHWPITGANSACHTSGGHTNAILKNLLAYQPFDPAEVGNKVSFIFGPSSGGNHAKTVIEGFGYRCDEQEKAPLAQFVKDYYHDRRKGITDDELLLAYFQFRQPIRVNKIAYAKQETVSTLTIDGDFFDHHDVYVINYTGKDSALAALHTAIEAYMPGLSIENYLSQATSKGVDALSEAIITINTDDDKIYEGIGRDADIEISALKALIHAVNQAYIEQHYKI